jgi:hypothetical protein
VATLLACKPSFFPQTAEEKSISDGAGALHITAIPSIPANGETRSLGICFYQQVGKGSEIEIRKGSVAPQARYVRYEYASMHGDTALKSTVFEEFFDDDYGLPPAFQMEKHETIDRLYAAVEECQKKTDYGTCQQIFSKDLDATLPKLWAKHGISKSQVESAKRKELVEATVRLKSHFAQAQLKSVTASAKDNEPTDFLDSHSPEIYKYAISKILEMASNPFFQSKQKCKTAVSQLEAEPIR